MFFCMCLLKWYVCIYFDSNIAQILNVGNNAGMWGEKLKQRLDDYNVTPASCFIKVSKLVILYNNFLILIKIPAFVHLAQVF